MTEETQNKSESNNVEGFVANELSKDKQRPNQIPLPDNPEDLKKMDWPQTGKRDLPKVLKTDKLQIFVDEPQFPLNYQTRRNVQIVEYLCSLSDDKVRLEWLRRKVFKPETIQRFMEGVESELAYRKRIMENNGHEK